MSADENLSPVQFGESKPVTYDRNIIGQVTAHLPSGKSGTFYTAGSGLTRVRHPEDTPEPMYHGSPNEITGQVETGHPSNYVGRPMSHVYMTSHLASARNYAHGKGHVYQVRPTGWYGHRRDAKGDNWASSQPLDVVRKVSREELESARKDWDKELGQ